MVPASDPLQALLDIASQNIAHSTVNLVLTTCSVKEFKSFLV